MLHRRRKAKLISFPDGHVPKNNNKKKVVNRTGFNQNPIDFYRYIHRKSQNRFIQRIQKVFKKRVEEIYMRQRQRRRCLHLKHYNQLVAEAFRPEYLQLPRTIRKKNKRNECIKTFSPRINSGSEIIKNIYTYMWKKSEMRCQSA